MYTKLLSRKYLISIYYLNYHDSECNIDFLTHNINNSKRIKDRLHDFLWDVLQLVILQVKCLKGIEIVETHCRKLVNPVKINYNLVAQ